MPVTEKKYPEWVQKHRVKGTTVKKRGILITFIKNIPACKREKISAAGRYLYRHYYSGRGNTKQQKEGIFNRCRSMGIRVFKNCLGIVPG